MALQTPTTPSQIEEFEHIWRTWLNTLREQVYTLQNTPTIKTLNISDIPTSSTGLSSGDVWSNSGVLTIIP